MGIVDDLASRSERKERKGLDYEENKFNQVVDELLKNFYKQCKKNADRGYRSVKYIQEIRYVVPILDVIEQVKRELERENFKNIQVYKASVLKRVIGIEAKW